MRPGNNTRRPRGRPNRKHNVSPRSQAFDSHGPDVRIRGNAPQIYEKYQTLARDAASAGDRVASESYFQFAEHYFRIMNDSTDPQRPGQPPRHRPEQAHDVQEQPIASHEQPHVQWPADDSGANGTAARAKPAAEAQPVVEAKPAVEEEVVPEERARQRPDSKPRQRSRRRPANGSEERSAEAAADSEPVAEDTKTSRTDAGDEKSTTPVE